MPQVLALVDDLILPSRRFLARGAFVSELPGLLATATPPHPPMEDPTP